MSGELLLSGGPVGVKYHAKYVECEITYLSAAAALKASLEAEDELNERLTENVMMGGEYDPTRITLEKEVLLLEDEVAEQQRLVLEAHVQAIEVTGTLRRYLQDALTLRQKAEHEADAASRRLCVAVTEGRGQLQLLCHQARHTPSPKLDEVLKWLEKQDYQQDKAHVRVSPALLRPIPQSVLYVARNSVPLDPFKNTTKLPWIRVTFQPQTLT
ncbi:hypothetical protein GWK47_005967 [Chionoecetes opilio]|uniref:Uncharacterized protein n=1 Tax=Chionoecetes opilio TaxID=41210 RepID=A0A8J4Y6T8_CHIOP|nr:hypothetical protein GWK47_005967 [Chionoecetes opilio]